MKKILSRWSVSIALAVAALGASQANAALLGPYSADADTLQLWHMDDGPAAASATNAVGSGLTMQGVLNGATLGNPARPGFGTSLDVSAGATSIVSSGNPTTVPPHRAILLGAPALSTSNGGADSNIDDVTLAFSNAATGAFTFEMMVKLNSNYDPSQPFRGTAATAAPGTNNGAYPMELIAGEGDTVAGGRPFQWRIIQVGFNAGGNSTVPKLEFNNIAGGGGQFFANIPTTGTHAINNTDWFHVAITYTGTPAVAGNVTMYWTKVDPSQTVANPIGSFQMSADLVSNATPFDFAIGNEARSNGTGFGEGENFYGSIDEVRISSVARGADQFIFALVPEPTAGVMALSGLALAGLLRRRSA